MSVIKDGGPAFPQHVMETRDGAFQCSYDAVDGAGLSLRDYFAAHAPISPIDWSLGQSSVDIDALRAYRWADTTLKAREAK